MLPSGAFAVILLLNGVQIWLPAPAFVEKGRAWAPARPVLQRCGYEVSWNAAARRMTATGEGGEFQFAASGREDVAKARMLGGAVYLAVGDLRPLGLVVKWSGEEKLVSLQRMPAMAREAPLGEILADPVSFLDALVRLRGEYLGWTPYPYYYASSGGPPAGVGDWVLRNEDGAIYCTAAAMPTQEGVVSLSRDNARPFSLGPYENPGRRLQVEASVRLSANGRPYLAVYQASPLQGQEGRVCCLTADQAAGPDGRLGLQLVASSIPPGGAGVPVKLQIEGPGGLVRIAEESFASLNGGSEVSLTGDSILVGSVSLPEGAREGLYRLVATMSDGRQSYPCPFIVQSAEASAETDDHD